MDHTNFEKTWQRGELHRQVNSLIVAHLRDSNLHQAASTVALATMTPLSVEIPPNKLLDIVAKGFAVEKDEILRGGVSSNPICDSGTGISKSHGLIPVPRTFSFDFSVVNDRKGSSKSFPKHEARHVSEHKNAARCARFSPDGRFVATGSADTSIKLFEVSKIKQMMLPAPDTRDGPVRPVIRTFYDHQQPINDLDFHPTNPVMISGAKDQTIKFFDFSKTVAKRAFRVIQDTHNVHSVSFHPSGDFLLAGTDHPIAHLYDVKTFQCYLSADVQDNTLGAINQVRYSTSGGMYVTASKDGAIRIWDGITANCVRSIVAHDGAEAVSANFTKDQRFVLSCGKDSSVKLWEVSTGKLVKQYHGATHTKLRCQAVFNNTEEFVLSMDEPNNEIVIWDAMTAEIVARWPSNHIGAPCWLEYSPAEAAFVTSGSDRSVRFWKETL